MHFVWAAYSLCRELENVNFFNHSFSYVKIIRMLAVSMLTISKLLKHCPVILKHLLLILFIGREKILEGQHDDCV